MFVQTYGIRMRHTIDGPEGAPWVTIITDIVSDTALCAD